MMTWPDWHVSRVTSCNRWVLTTAYGFIMRSIQGFLHPTPLLCIRGRDRVIVIFARAPNIKFNFRHIKLWNERAELFTIVRWNNASLWQLVQTRYWESADLCGPQIHKLCNLHSPFEIWINVFSTQLIFVVWKQSYINSGEKGVDFKSSEILTLASRCECFEQRTNLDCDLYFGTNKIFVGFDSPKLW